MMDSGREGLNARLDILWMLVCLGAGILLLRLLHIQLVQNVYYSQAAERNRTHVLRQTAPRGRLYARGGEIIATNQAVFSLIYLPPSKEQDAGTLERLAGDLAPHLKQYSGKLLQGLYRAIREESAIRLAEKLPPKIMFKLSELRTLYPGINLIVEARRQYPYGASAAHLLGYMGRMDEASWKRLKGRGYRIDSWIGKSGIEKVFEQDLRGRDGGIRMEVDARGRLRQILESIPWTAGSNIYMTIDWTLQKAAEEALRQSTSGSGAAVVLDPKTGDVLAFASLPDFDPNLFLQPDEENSPGRAVPEFNLALQGAFPPGSIFKIITGAAMLNEGRVSPEDRVFCPGYFELGNRPFMCWEHKGHRWQDWLSGIAHSCDVYFYKMGLRTGGELIERYQRMFRLGLKTQLGLPGESAGRVFGPAQRRARGGAWYDGDTVNLSIGQGELLVTPIQMAVVIAAVANRGTIWRPHLIKRIEYEGKRPEYRQEPEIAGQVPMRETTWELLQEGLERVVSDGTGRGVQIPGLTIGGKTGTAQNPGGDDHAWFVAYAGRPGEEPSLALAILVHHGGHGAEAAIPVARRILQAAFPQSAKAPIRLSTAPEGAAIPVELMHRSVLPQVLR